MVQYESLRDKEALFGLLGWSKEALQWACWQD